MRTSTYTSTALQDAPLGGEPSASCTPTRFLEIGEHCAANTMEIESAAGASGVDSAGARDVAGSKPGQFGSPASALTDVLSQEARTRRAVVVADMIAHAYRVVRRLASRAIERNRQRREAKATYDTLNRLDDRTLRDLGFDRLEISSVAAEASGRVEVTRIHALLLGEQT